MLNNALSMMRRGLINTVFLRTICSGRPVAINGMGRIGKSVLRQSFDKNVNIVAVNQPFADIKAVAQALKYDTVHGVFDKKIEIYDNTLCVDGRHVKVFHEENSEKIKWKDFIDYVIDSTGQCNEEQKAQKHIKAGAKKVLVTTVSKDVPIFIKGVNFDSYKKTSKVVSSGSSTGNCASVLIKALHKKFCIQSCLITTILPLNTTQPVHDGLDYKSGADNIVPYSTCTEATITSSLPDFKGKVHGDAARIPILNVSLLKLFMNVKENVTVDAIKAEIVHQVNSDLKDVLYYVDDNRVSSDFIGCKYSGVVDFNQIQIIDKLISIGVWYDNEVGYACRVLDLVNHMAEVDFKSV